MESQHLGLYVLASLALIATPGQDMLYVISRSLAQGRLAGVCSAVGVCLGILVHTALAALGVGAILMASEALFLALKLVGAAYLVYLGIRLLFARDAATAAPNHSPRFYVDEKCLKIGVKTIAALALDWLAANAD